MQEIAIRDTIFQSLDKSKMDAILYLNRKASQFKSTDDQIAKISNKSDDFVEQWKANRVRELQ